MPGKSAFRPRDAGLLILLALMWGNSFLFIKTAVAAVPPAWIVTGRMVIGVVLLGSLALLRKESRPDRTSVMNLGLIGIVGSALPWVGQAWAQQFLDSGLVSVLNACTPVATLILAVLSGQEPLYRNRVFGLALAVSGTVIVIGGEVGSGRSLLALLVAVLSTVGYALGAVLTRARVSGRVSNMSAAVWQLATGACILAPIAFTLSGPPPLAIAPTALGAIAALGLFGTGLAFLIFLSLIHNVGATNASMVTYLVPIVGLTSGALFRGERFGHNVFLGAATLVGGVWLAQRTPPSVQS